jgi:hypothetical protein
VEEGKDLEAAQVVCFGVVFDEEGVVSDPVVVS